MRKPLFWTAALLMALAWSAADARVLRVNLASQAGNPDGNSWATAYPTISGALAAASSGDELWVAAGVYRENPVVRAGRSMYGGFVGVETQRSGRDWRANPTVIDGQRLGSALAMDGEKTRDEMVLDGFTLVNGSGTFLAGSESSLGGGLYAVHAYLQVRNCTFSGNGTPTYGGGAAMQGCRGVVENCVFIDNGVTEWGGGLHVEDSSITVRSSRFTRNRESSRGSGLCSYRGDLTVTDSVFSENLARVIGAAVYAHASEVRLINNTLADNYSPLGGAVHLTDSNLVAGNNIVAFNSASFTHFGSTFAFHNNCVFGNQDAGNGSAVVVPTTGGNLAADPRLVHLPGGDLRIRPDSPCRNAGRNDLVIPGGTDAAGGPRIQPGLGNVDIGAYESDGAPVTPPAARVLRVRPGGDDAVGDGSTWPAAFRTVEKALLEARPGDQVWLAEGTYVGRWTLPRHVALYGGFAGSETALGERVPGTGAAILRGDGTGSVVTIEPGAMPDTVLDTLRIEQGRSENTGGGVLAEMAWPTLSRLTLTDNAADQGGAVGIVFGGAVLTDLVVSGNTAETFGGGIFVKDASVTLSSSRFSGNTTSNSGAGIAVYRSRFLLDSILCYENTAETNGGAVYILESTGSLVNATLADNAAAFGGGGLYTRSSTMNVANCIAVSNGTGLVNSSGNVSTQNCILFGNAVANQIDVRLDSATFFTDPLFVDQGNRDYHLQSQSPAINRGLTSLARGSFDLDGNPRVLGIAVDIGAYEAAGPLPLDEVRLALRICAGLAAGTPAELTRLDRTQDGVVTLRDAAHLARSLAR